MSSDTHKHTNEPAAVESQKDLLVHVIYGLCREPLVEGRDDIYAERCVRHAWRQREKRRLQGRTQNEGGIQH